MLKTATFIFALLLGTASLSIALAADTAAPVAKSGKLDNIAPAHGHHDNCPMHKDGKKCDHNPGEHCPHHEGQPHGKHHDHNHEKCEHDKPAAK